MREIDLDNITGNELVDYEVLVTAFKKHLIDILEYSEDEANFVIKCDFEDPYDTPFLDQDWEGNCVIDGKEYEVRSCRTDFCMCGLYHLAEMPPFEFYMFFELDSLPDKTVGSYRKSKKLYLV